MIPLIRISGAKTQDDSVFTEVRHAVQVHKMSVLSIQFVRQYFDCLLTDGRWSQQNECLALWIDCKLCCNCSESLADTSSNETQRSVDPDMCSHAQIQTLNPSGLSCVGPSRQHAGTKPIISRCVLVLLSKKNNIQEIWGYIMAPWCKLRLEPCSVQCWEGPLQAMLISHKQWRLHADKLAEGLMVWQDLAFRAFSNSKPSLTQRITWIV